jgi:D-tyrosyl-tRNA(Tyr) deacylase
MRSVIQRVSSASVMIMGQKVSEIHQGLVVFLGVGKEDTKEDALWLANKISALRIFADGLGVMNKSITATRGEVIVISQFTLYAKIKKGNRPSYIKAELAEKSIPLYEKFKEYLSLAIGKQVQSGEFGSDMKVSLINDGPITIIIDTKNKQ